VEWKRARTGLVCVRVGARARVCVWYRWLGRGVRGDLVRRKADVHVLERERRTKVGRRKQSGDTPPVRAQRLHHTPPNGATMLVPRRTGPLPTNDEREPAQMLASSREALLA
jgi:hypothetical protein